MLKKLWHLLFKTNPFKIIFLLFVLLLILEGINQAFDYVLYDIEIYVFFTLVGFTAIAGIFGFVKYIIYDVLNKKPKI